MIGFKSFINRLIFNKKQNYKKIESLQPNRQKMISLLTIVSKKQLLISKHL